MTNSETIGSGTVAGAVQYLDFLSTKGHVVPGATAALKTAFIKVLKTLNGDDWEKTEVRTIDIDEYMRRFGNMTHGQYNAKSLTDYKTRIYKVVTWYLEFLSKPGWIPPVKLRKSTKNPKSEALAKPAAEANSAAAIEEPTLEAPAPSPTSTKSSLVAFPFPLSDGVLASLYLPTKINAADAKRMARFIETLVIEDVENE